MMDTAQPDPVHGSVTNDFNQERHLASRENYKERRAAAPPAERSVVG